jgi:hypothetical protein
MSKWSVDACSRLTKGLEVAKDATQIAFGIAKKCLKAKMEVRETGLDLPANRLLRYNLGLGTVETIRSMWSESSSPSLSDMDSIGS